MSQLQERNERFYSVEGIEAMRARLKTLIQLYNEGKFKVSARVLGFGNLNIESKEELIGRIKEIADWIGQTIVLEKEVVKMSDGSLVEKEVLI